MTNPRPMVGSTSALFVLLSSGPLFLTANALKICNSPDFTNCAGLQPLSAAEHAKLLLDWGRATATFSRALQVHTACWQC